MPEKANLSCSFCGKSQEKVRTLVVGPSVCICDECIALASDIVQESRTPSAAQYIHHAAEVLQIEKAQKLTLEELLGTAEDSGVLRGMTVVDFMSFIQDRLKKVLQPEIEALEIASSAKIERLQVELKEVRASIKRVQTNRKDLLAQVQGAESTLRERILDASRISFALEQASRRASQIDKVK